MSETEKGQYAKQVRPKRKNAPGAGRPKISEEDRNEMREKIRSQFWTPGSGPVSSQPEVYLPPPPGKKGSTQYKVWAMECFIELVRHGLNYSQAAKRLGYTYTWWSQLRKENPDWEKEVLEARNQEVKRWEYPDITKMPFEEFLLTYAPYGYLPDHHQLMADALQDPLGKLILILGHPESAKSTIVSLWYVLYRLCQDPDHRVALVSKSSSKAQDLLTRVKRHMTETHLYDEAERSLIEDFNGFKPTHGDLQWSQDQIYIKHRVSGERDPSIQALGIGKQIYGARLDLLILDDALVLDNQTSELQRERLDNWFTNEARSRAQRGQTVVNGTRLFPHDLYGQWKKSWAEHRLFRGVYIPAILDEYSESERPNWKEFWTLDGYDIEEEVNGETIITGHQPGLRDIREEISARDPARWKLVYQQEDIEESENVFRQAHVDAALELGATRKLGQIFDHEVLILGVDPATSGRAASVLVALDPATRVRTVVDIFVGAQLGATGIRDSLFYQFWDRYREHRVNFTVVETNFAPTLLGDEAFQARADAAGTQIVPHRTVGRGHKRGSKWDEEYGIGAMASLFAGGLISFANAGLDDRARLQPLIDDMLTFPWSEQQDALVGLWVAEGEAKVPRHEAINQTNFARQRGAPPSILRRRR